MPTRKVLCNPIVVPQHFTIFTRVKDGEPRDDDPTSKQPIAVNERRRAAAPEPQGSYVDYWRWSGR